MKPKSVKQQRAAGRPQSKALVITLRIPPEVLPLFETCQMVMRQKDPRKMAEWLILKGLTSEVIMERFDTMVSRLL